MAVLGLMKEYKYEFKIGDWLTCGDETFFVAKTGEGCVGGSWHTDWGYFDMWHEFYLTYHCEKATQAEIEQACKALLDNDL